MGLRVKEEKDGAEKLSEKKWDNEHAVAKKEEMKGRQSIFVMMNFLWGLGLLLSALPFV